jgi:hypothetical protein
MSQQVSGIDADPPRRVAGAPPPRPPSSGERRTPPWVLIAIGLLALVVWWSAAQVLSLQDRLDSLESTVAATAMTVTVPASTVAPPVEIPPADAETARRLIRDALGAVFSADLPVEQRATWVQDPAGVAAQLASLGAGPCGAGVQVVLTELRFVDDDTAWVRFRFEGPGVPSGGNGIEFDGAVHRAPERWLLDRALVDGVLSTAAPFCD